MRFKVFQNGVFVQPIADSLNVTIQAKAKPMFSGNADSCVQFLKELGVGKSVEIRRYDSEGNWQGTRSCMNKPSLWSDILESEL